MVSGHPVGMCCQSTFHSFKKKIMKGQSSRARHKEGRQSRGGSGGNEAGENSIRLSRQPHAERTTQRKSELSDARGTLAGEVDKDQSLKIKKRKE